MCLIYEFQDCGIELSDRALNWTGLINPAKCAVEIVIDPVKYQPPPPRRPAPPRRTSNDLPILAQQRAQYRRFLSRPAWDYSLKPMRSAPENTLSPVEVDFTTDENGRFNEVMIFNSAPLKAGFEAGSA
ncbi:MAG: hypothetical protein ABJG15_08520 [Hyphomonadaceae bacterium]